MDNKQFDAKDGAIKVFCPGTVANLVCGFDILGLALSDPSDIMEVKLLDEPKVIIHNRDNFISETINKRA